jgi:hypothetical protein
MRKPTRSQKKLDFPLKEKTKHNFNGLQTKITFRCDIFLIEKIKNMLASQHLAGNYQYPNLSYFFRSALHAYQAGNLTLTYQRQNNPRKEISFCLTEDLFNFYNSLPARSKAGILERVLGYFCQQG